MKLTYYGNAMMLLESKRTRILCDPWVTFDRYSSSGLFNYPEIPISKAAVVGIKPDFIYITHTHADHFDPITLSLFSKDTPIIISWYERNFTEKNIRQLGFKDIRISDRERGLLLNGDDHCWLEPSEVYSDVDSIGIFRLDNLMIVNANDNPYHEGHCQKILNRFGPIEIACIPFSAQGPYPAFYKNLTPNEKLDKSHAKKERNYQAMVNYVKTLNPKVVFPFAAGAVYGGQKALDRRFYGVGTQVEAMDHIRRHTDGEVLGLSNGGVYDFATNTYEKKIFEVNESQDDYLKSIAGLPGAFDKGGLFYIEESEWIDLTHLLMAAREKQFVWQERRGIGLTNIAFFLDTGQSWLYRLTLADRSVTKVMRGEISDEVYEIFELPYALLIGLLTKHYNFSNVKTQHIYFYRKPDIFHSDLHLLMSFLQL